jgi:predicted homoserine dehydrogenase-like protein
VSLRDKLEALDREGTPIRVGLVGVGQMGRGLIAQVAGIPGMEVVAAADLYVERTIEAFREAGQDPVEGLNGHPGRPAVTADATELTRSEAVDVVVEATGVTEIGARVAYDAIHEGKHVVMLNAETDVTIGAVLGRMARSAGVVYTGSAGDEPGVIMDLYDFARSLGFEVVVAGKGKNNPLDVSATPESVAEEAERKRMNPKMLAAFVDGTKTMVEMAAVANAIGFHPDVPNMHGPEETVPNRLGELFSLKDEGGILSSYGVVDYVRGVAPGVFVIVRSGAEPVRETMEYLGHGGRPEPRVLPALPPHEPGDPDLRRPRRHLRRAHHNLRGETHGRGRGRGEAGSRRRREARRHRLGGLLRGPVPVLGGQGDASAGPGCRGAHHAAGREG